MLTAGQRKITFENTWRPILQLLGTTATFVENISKLRIA